MYKNGVTFPTFLFFQNDELKITCIDDYRKQSDYCKEHILNGDNLEDYLSTLFNKEQPILFVHIFAQLFPYLLFNSIEVEKIQLKSKYFDLKKFNKLIRYNDFNKILDYTEKLKSNPIINNFNEELFYSKLYVFLYKLYFVRLAECVKISNGTNSKVIFKTDIEKYVRYATDFDNNNNRESNFDQRKNYVLNVRKSLNILPFSLKLANDKLLEIYHFVEYNNKDLLSFIFDSVSFIEGSTRNSQNASLRELFFYLGSQNLKCFIIYNKSTDKNYVVDFRQFRLDLEKK